MDAEFVVTDSFHGCVLAILMHKRFIAVGNSYRGTARLRSLLDMFGLDMRLVQGIDPEDDGEYFLSDIDWDKVFEGATWFHWTGITPALGGELPEICLPAGYIKSSVIWISTRSVS